VLVAAPYPFFERIRLAVAAQHGAILDEEFAADVTITARFAVEHLNGFQTTLQEMSNGMLEAIVVATDEATIMPIEPPET
jgi:hypothetical protein